MKKKSGIISTLVNLAVWLTGVLVSLAVGFGMTDGTLSVPFLPGVLTTAAGWIVIVLAILGVLFKIVDKVSAG